MYAVVIEVDVHEVDPEEGLTALRQHVVPAIKQLPGFQSGVWLPGNEQGLGLSLTVWDTEAHARTMADRFGVGSSPAQAASIARCEVREIAVLA